MERPARKSKKANPSKDSDEEAEMELIKLQMQSKKLHPTFVLYCLLITGSFFIGYNVIFSSYKTNPLDEIIHSVGLSENIYAVIIDAGSTGSRVLVPSFYKSVLSGNLKLHDDLFIQNKPGLSSFPDNPKEGAKKIMELIENAKEYIPEEHWNSTPIALRATAGLRLLPPEKAEHILLEVKEVIEKSPFLSNENSVAIMDGKDEGLYSWFTVNFLFDRIKGDLSKSVLTFDLGGGSVQITFVPHESSKLHETEYIHPVSILNHKVNTYSYSYLGLGLMAAREEVFLLENEANNLNIASSCVSSEVKNKPWNYGTKKYLVSGAISHKFTNKNEPIVDFEKCYEMVKKVVQKGNVDKPRDIDKYEIVAFSYFFDRASQCGLVDGYDGGIVKIKELKQIAKKNCEMINTKQPLMCLDLTFISVLLEYGFGLKPEIPISLLDTVDGHEISWALGAAYFILENGL